MKTKRILTLFVLVGILIGSGFISCETTPIIQPPAYNFSTFVYTFDDPFLADSVVLRIVTSVETTCYYEEIDGIIPNKEFDGNYGTKHEKFLKDLDEGIHDYYIRCGSSSNPVMKVVFKIKKPVYGTIDISEEPPLKEGQYEITLTTSKECSETPTLEYTLDGITKKEISLSGSGTSWRGYLIVPGNTGETIGYFEFNAYDVYGTNGKKLVGDSLFIIDTIKPDAISIINAIGYEGQTRLEWFYEEDIEEFNIYKSENPYVDYTDFYKTTSNKYYTDNDVEKGKTYYYRVSGVDKAGNIADLSKEVYATSLLTNDSVSESGLDIKLVGRVDNMISEINSLILDIQEIKSGIKAKQGKEKELFEDLKFDKEIDNIISELNSLKRDVEKYKLQDLSENELENKLNSAELRINIIKKKTPEDLIVVEEKSISREINEQDIERATLEYLGELSENLKKEIDFVFDIAKERNLKIKSNFYNLEIIYMDGSDKEITVVEDYLNSQIDQIEDFFFVVVVPKDIVEKSSELEIMNINYEVVKEDPVLLFYSDTKKITYYIEKKVSSGSLENILVSPIKIINEEEKPGITGNLISNYANPGSLGVFGLVVICIVLFIYFLRVRKKEDVKPTLKTLDDIRKVGEFLEQGKNKEAKELYSKIRKEYKTLSKKEKKLVVEELKEINNENIKW